MSSDEPGARRASCSGPGCCQPLALHKAGRSPAPRCPACAGAGAARGAGGNSRAARLGRATGAAGAGDAEPFGGCQPAPDRGRSSVLAPGPPGCILQIPAAGGAAPGLRQHVLLRERGSGGCGTARTCARAGQLTEQRSALF